MPTATHAPGPLLAVHPSWEIPAPTSWYDGSGFIGSWPAGGPASGTTPAPLALSLAARRARLWDDILFAVIHVIPRVKDVGAVTGDVEFAVEVWNPGEYPAYGASVAIAGDAGVTLKSGPSLPAWWGPQSSTSYTVNVAGAGVMTIEATITWDFPGYSGTDCRVTGIRALVRIVAIDWGKGLDLELGFEDQVLTSHNGSEQRFLLSEIMRRAFAYRALETAGPQVQKLATSLFVGGQALFAVPFWPDVSPLTGPVVAGATYLPCETADRAFSAASRCLLWRADGSSECFTVESVDAGGVHVSPPAADDWPAASSAVLPVFTARLDDSSKATLLRGDMAEAELVFRTEPTV